MSGWRLATTAPVTSRKSSAAWLASRQHSSAARFSFQQNRDSHRRIAREGSLHLGHCVLVMKTNRRQFLAKGMTFAAAAPLLPHVVAGASTPEASHDSHGM